MARLLLLALIFPLAVFPVDSQVDEPERSRELADVAKLAAITHADQSTIFFTGLIGAGYARNGKISMLARFSGDFYARHECYGSAVSQDGTRLVYAAPSTIPPDCRLTLQDLETGQEKELTETGPRPAPMSWSWDDSRILYQSANGVLAVSVVDRGKQVLGPLPLHIRGNLPFEGWQLFSVEWFHQRPELMLDAELCVPAGKPGGCIVRRYVLILSTEGSRLLDAGACASVSPKRDSVAYVANDGVVVMNADGTDRRTVTPLPSTVFFLPFFKEEPWTSIVWAPDGQRLWFNTIIDEGGRTNAYLVDVKKGQRNRILRHSMIIVTAWRRSSKSEAPVPQAALSRP